MDKLLIAPSTDPAKTVEDIIEFVDEIKNDADLLHCDIMDGKFVESKTFSYDVLKIIKEKTLLPLDVHLMIESPSKFIKKYFQSGANIITVHFEAYKDKKKLIKDLKKIRKLGALSGLSIKPKTAVEEILTYIVYCDIILIMSVEPGKSGQKFIEQTYSKVIELNKIKKDFNIKLKIEIDGGINPSVSKKLKEFGADILVSGSYVYNSKNRLLAINDLRWTFNLLIA